MFFLAIAGQKLGKLKSIKSRETRQGADRCRSQSGMACLLLMICCIVIDWFASLAFFVLFLSAWNQEINTNSRVQKVNNHIKSDKRKWVLHGSDNLKFLSDRKTWLGSFSFFSFLFFGIYITRCLFFKNIYIYIYIELGLIVTSLLFSSYNIKPGNVQCTIHECPQFRTKSKWLPKAPSPA